LPQAVGWQSLPHPRQLLLRCSSTAHPWTYALASYRYAESLQPGRLSDVLTNIDAMSQLNHRQFPTCPVTCAPGSPLIPSRRKALRFPAYSVGPRKIYDWPQNPRKHTDERRSSGTIYQFISAWSGFRFLVYCNFPLATRHKD
jgi:hypothetical protein